MKWLGWTRKPVAPEHAVVKTLRLATSLIPQLQALQMTNQVLQAPQALPVITSMEMLAYQILIVMATALLLAAYGHGLLVLAGVHQMLLADANLALVLSNDIKRINMLLKIYFKFF